MSERPSIYRAGLKAIFPIMMAVVASRNYFARYIISAIPSAAVN